MTAALRRIGFSLAAPLVAVVIAVAATTLVIAASGSTSSPGDFWSILLKWPAGRIQVNIVNQAVMIYLAAISAAIGFRMGLFNIGVEGQYTLASYLAAAFAGAAILHGALNVVVAVLIAVAAGAGWAGIAAVLRVTRGVSEVISTIMLNAIGGILVGYLLDHHGQHIGDSVRTTPLQASSEVPGWQPYSTADGSIWGLGLLAVVVGVGFWLLLGRTRFGFDLRASGLSPSAATASGVHARRMVIAAMLLSGAVAGLIWMPALFGSAHTYGNTFQSQLGFTGIAVALLGRNRPLGIAFGALLFAYLSAQSNSLTLFTDISPSIVLVTQGVAVLAVVIAYEIVRRARTRIEQRSVAATTAPRPAGRVEATS